MDFAQNSEAIKLQFVSGIMRLELPDVADPPDVVAFTIFSAVFPVHFATGDLLRHRDSFEHGTIRKTAATNVVDHSRSGRLEKPVERSHQVRAVHVVANLFAFIAKNGIAGPGNVTFHQVGEKAM